MSVNSWVADYGPNDLEELSWTEYGLNVAKQEFSIAAISLLDDEPVLIVCDVCKVGLSHMAVYGIIYNEEDKGIVVCIMNEF